MTFRLRSRMLKNVLKHKDWSLFVAVCLSDRMMLCSLVQ
jgi:hypothetical protein